MPRIFDNITQHLRPALAETMRVVHRADFCVGYFNLRGWRSIDEHVERWPGGEGRCCRVLVGMQRLPQEELRAARSLSADRPALDNRTALRLKKKLAEEFREQLTFGAPTNQDEAGLRRLARQIRARKVVVRLFLRHPLHAKLYLLFRSDPREFENLTYRTLEDEDRRRLDDSILHAIVIRQEDPGNDDSSVYMVFERLNTTSTALSPQEIRACVYHGSFNDYLAEANRNRDWRAIFGKPSARQKDRELLLRFFALFYKLDSYKRPMKLFLNGFMYENRHLKRHDQSTLNGVLEPTMALVNETLGREAFRPQHALNASVTDAILVGVARRLRDGPVTDRNGFKAALDPVLRDEGFADLYTLGTTNPDKVRARIDKVARALRSVG